MSLLKPRTAVRATFPFAPSTTSSTIRRGLAALITCTVLTPGMVAAQNAAVVNNKPIPLKRLDGVVQQMVSQGRPDTPELRAAIRDQLILRTVFVQEAERSGLTSDTEVQLQLEQAREDVLIRALISHHLAKVAPVTDDEIKREFDKRHGGAAEKEYRARHILVEREDEAKAIIEQLGKGARFEDLAKQSKDPGSAQQGGDLDWNTAETFVREFADAMAALEKGKFTLQPVRTQFGFHVIRLDDVRVAPPPPMGQVAPQIKQELERARIDKLQVDLRGAAKIQ
ncbi:MAG: putative peptidyl-prolyl cis-trans isomerase Cbf2 precursor [Pseudomonadota bacterium]